MAGSSLCFIITFVNSAAGAPRFGRIDFSSLTEINYTTPSALIRYTSVAAVDDTDAIYAGYDTSSSPHKLVYVAGDIANAQYSWGKETNTADDIYGTTRNRRIYSYVNSDSSKYVSIMAQLSSALIVVLNPSTGDVIDVRQLTFSTTFTNMELFANGKVSDNMIVVSLIVSSENSNLMSFVNTDTWESTGYKASSSLQLSGFSPLFNTNQIVLLMTDKANYWSLQAGYDTFNYTELFITTTDTIADVSTSFNFTSKVGSLTVGTEATVSNSLSNSTSTFVADNDLTYKATVNIFNSSAASVSGTTDDTALGPLQFNCYNVTSNANNASFADQLIMTQSDEQTIPSWMSFDPVSANLSLSDPEVSNATYIISNFYIGSFGNFTLDTSFSISIAVPTVNTTGNTTGNVTNNNNEEDDDHCLNASSEALCGFFIFLIIAGVLTPIIFVLVLTLIKCKARRNVNNDMTKVDQEQADEGNDEQNNDESAPLGHQNDPPNTENQEAIEMDRIQDNQV